MCRWNQIASAARRCFVLGAAAALAVGACPARCAAEEVIVADAPPEPAAAPTTRQRQAPSPRRPATPPEKPAAPDREQAEPANGLVQSKQPPEVRPKPSAGDRGADAAPTAHDEGDDRLVPETGPLEIAPAQFKGVQPGLTTAAEVLEALGEPTARHDDGPTRQMIFQVDPFDHVAVTFEGETVASIVVNLERAFPAEALADELGLSRIVAIEVLDEQGEPLGLAFPERGVLFSFAGGKTAADVTQIILDPVSAESFVLRAEKFRGLHRSASLDDLGHALQIMPDLARAHWLKAEILSEAGRMDEAQAALDEALRLAPDDGPSQLTAARLEARTGRLGTAVAKTRQIAAAAAGQPALEARARIQLGDLLGAGSQADFQAASQEHLAAIKLVQPLATARSAAVRREARRLLLEAHLGEARDIARGNWKRKAQVVQQWLARAEAISQDLLRDEPGNPEPTLRLVSSALASYEMLPVKTSEVERWVEKLNQLAIDHLPKTDDAMSRQQLEWEVGLGLGHAMQIAHARGQFDRALDYGSQAAGHLERGFAERQQDPPSAYQMGRLYFRMGSVYALHHENHAAAVEWFDKALPLLERPLPELAAGESGLHADMFVSIGVSLWERGQHQRAVEVTTRGAKLLEAAQRAGLAAADALAVPYGNLASMHRELGHEEQAANYERLATQPSEARRR